MNRHPVSFSSSPLRDTPTEQYSASEQPLHHHSNANIQPMPIPRHGSYGNLTEDYAYTYAPSLWASPALPDRSTSHTLQETVFHEYKPPRQISEYLPPHNCSPCSVQVVRSNLIPSSTPFPYTYPQRAPSSSLVLDSYPGCEAYDDLNCTGMMCNHAQWLPESDRISMVAISRIMDPRIAPCELSHPDCPTDMSYPKEMPSPITSRVSNFSNINSKPSLSTQLEVASLDFSSTDGQNSQTSSTQNKPPRAMTTRAEANYECSMEGCGKMFNRSYNYKAHMETHDPERVYPFTCQLPDCTKRFRRKTDLQRHHQSVHMKERNHQCEFCGRFFSRKDTLRRQVLDTCIRD